MKRRLFLTGLPGLAGCTRETRPRLNVYNWSDYIGPDTVPGFEREFGVRVRYGIFESNEEEVLARTLSGNSGWDVVFPSNYLIEPMRQNGLLAPLRHQWLTNLANLAPAFQQPSWDPRLQWCVPYMAGASGIVSQSAFQPSAWADLWKPNLRGRITMLDDPAEVIGACLKKLGLPLNSVDPSDLDKARREAVEQKRLLRAYLNAEVRDQLVSGDVLAAQLWVTTSQQAMRAAPGLRFAYPAEGFARYADNAVVLQESRRQEMAHRFIDYLLRPRVAAGIVQATRTATANARALELLPPEIGENPVLYPPPDTLARGEWFEPLPPAGQRLRDRLWTEIKSS